MEPPSTIKVLSEEGPLLSSGGPRARWVKESPVLEPGAGYCMQVKVRKKRMHAIDAAEPQSSSGPEPAGPSSSRPKSVIKRRATATAALWWGFWSNLTGGLTPYPYTGYGCGRLLCTVHPSFGFSLPLYVKTHEVGVWEYSVLLHLTDINAGTDRQCPLNIRLVSGYEHAKHGSSIAAEDHMLGVSNVLL